MWSARARHSRALHLMKIVFAGTPEFAAAALAALPEPGTSWRLS